MSVEDVSEYHKSGVLSAYNRFGRRVAQNFYSIPTSKIAYEFTRKVYKLLELDVNAVEAKYTSYDLINDAKLTQDQSLHINKKRLKFDVIVGNPPYQQSDGGAQASAKPIYNLFVEAAKELNPACISMIMPTRWYAGGKGLDVFRGVMLNDKHISELHDFLKPNILFQNINNRGGICYFIRDKSYDNSKNLTKFFTYKNNLTPVVSMRSLKTFGSDILIRHSIALEIITKVKSHKEFSTFENYISSRKPFDLEGNVVNDEKKFRLDKKGLKDPVLCYGKSKKIGFIERDNITKNANWIDNYKVFAPYANNIGTELNDDNLNAFVGGPKTICTETFIVIGATLNLNLISSANLVKYFFTKFARFMHSLAKVSQHGTAKTYRFVPLEDFSAESDIDWGSSIADIDRQLYKKYGLTAEEVAFIESMIKPMNSENI